jgi:hypothetical protein
MFQSDTQYPYPHKKSTPHPGERNSIVAGVLNLSFKSTPKISPTAHSCLLIRVRFAVAVSPESILASSMCPYNLMPSFVGRREILAMTVLYLLESQFSRSGTKDLHITSATNEEMHTLAHSRTPVVKLTAITFESMRNTYSNRDPCSNEKPYDLVA